MKFLVDAQLPVRLARFLQASGYDTLHTRDLPASNQTPDSVINTLSIEQNRIVITKDADFVESFILQQQPYKLLLITRGNITNFELESLFAQNLDYLVELLEQYSYIELSRDAIAIHQ
jgi:predicted nuclease of predicted toxin-antitoxin system